MTLFQRIGKILIGIFMIIFAVLFIMDPTEDTYQVLVAILAFGLAVKGLKDIIFYFTMARHMVGGKMILFQGVVVLDFAMLTGALADVPKPYVLLYLILIHAFSGVVEVLRAMEAKRTVAGPWKIKLTHGVINLGLALACFVFIRHTGTAIIIYSIGLIYAALIRIMSAFRRTAFVLIK